VSPKALTRDPPPQNTHTHTHTHQVASKRLPLSVETCAHYLLFAAENITDGDTRFKCAPPLRQEANRKALLAGIKAGDIDIVSSDHSPAPPDLKETESGDFLKAWGGIAGVCACVCVCVCVCASLLRVRAAASHAHADTV
jgi:dihydroorotase-like cyclic amidohydrolase